MSHFLSPLVEVGFFESAQVQLALFAGALAAIVTAAVGSFAVLRGQSFAGEALGDIGTTGGSGALLAGVSPLWGFVVLGGAAAMAMELLGVQRARGRDLAIGIVLGLGNGLAALFFWLEATEHNQTGAPVRILFGSIFAIPSSLLPAIVVLALAALGIVALLGRPLLLSSTSPEPPPRAASRCAWWAPSTCWRWCSRSRSRRSRSARSSAPPCSSGRRRARCG